MSRILTAGIAFATATLAALPLPSAECLMLKGLPSRCLNARIGTPSFGTRHSALEPTQSAVRTQQQPLGTPPPAQDTPSVRDLPLVEQTGEGERRGHSALAVILSGDGGWVAVDREMAATFAQHGVAVVGWNLRDYLHRARAPDETAHDLMRVLTHYLAAWHRERVVVVGYSRGADLAPFMVSRLDAELRERVVLVALLGPSDWAGFQFHLVDLILDKHRASDLPVRPEIEKLRGMKMLCIYGRGDGSAICPTLDPTLAQPVAHEGGHRVTAHEGRFMAEIILRALEGSE